jgi:hypothetical protein
MPELITVIVLILTLLIATLAPLAQAEDGFEAKKTLAWFFIAFTTLVLVLVIIFWVVSHMAADNLHTITTDTALFTEQIAWIVGACGALYALLWSLVIRPRFLDDWADRLVGKSSKKS